MTNIIFCDIDGVFNCQLFYEKQFAGKITFFNNIPLYKQVKKLFKKMAKNKEIEWDEYYKSQLCRERISWLNYLCESSDSVVVISSTWRHSKSPEELQRLFDIQGATFKIIDITPDTGYERGTEIALWLKENTQKYFGKMYFDFYNYAIIDDDNDMLLTQAPHFFKTDSYAGLTPMLCDDIRNFLTKNKYPNIK